MYKSIGCPNGPDCWYRYTKLPCRELYFFPNSYYPLYPPAVGVPLDLSLAPEALEIPSIPDLLLLPLDLALFVKVVSLGRDDREAIGCMCVNPGRLAKGIGGGTFVEIYYYGDPDKTNASIIRI